MGVLEESRGLKRNGRGCESPPITQFSLSSLDADYKDYMT